MNKWCVYILCCADNSLYTGITNNLEKRVKAHNDGLGAKYTKPRRPVKLAYQEPATSRSAASKREYVVKQLSRAEKQALIKAS